MLETLEVQSLPLITSFFYTLRNVGPHGVTLQRYGNVFNMKTRYGNVTENKKISFFLNKILNISKIVKFILALIK